MSKVWEPTLADMVWNAVASGDTLPLMLVAEDGQVSVPESWEEFVSYYWRSVN